MKIKQTTKATTGDENEEDDRFDFIVDLDFTVPDISLLKILEKKDRVADFIR